MGKSNNKAYIMGVGMVTPVGDTAKMTASSVRAGINRFAASPVYNKDSNFMKMALVPKDAIPPLDYRLQAKDDLSSNQRRMLRMAQPAVSEAMKNYPQDQTIPLFVAVPETLPDMDEAVCEKFLDYFIKQTGIKTGKQQTIFPDGRAGGILALDAAIKYLAEGHSDFALVGGTDSYWDEPLLDFLDEGNRVLAEGVADAFAPGEGAGFLLLASEKMAKSIKNGPLIAVSAPGIAEEAGHRYSEETYKGDGLAEAFTLAFENFGGERIKTIYTSLNGEHFGAKEYGVACIRSSENIEEDVRTEHPADCFGDIGAAFAPVLIGLSAIGLSKGYIKGPTMTYCSSELQQRGAVCVSVET